MSNVYHIFFTAVLMVIGVLLIACLVRAIRGPRIADRIVMLDKGYVKFDGPLADALQSPLPLVKNFFARASQEGHPGMQSLWQRSGANGATRNH